MFSSIFKKGKASNRLRSEKGKTDAASTSSVVEQGKKKEAGNVSVEGAFNSSEAQPMLLELEENERYDNIAEHWSFHFLLPTDPKRYTSVAGQLDEFPDDSMLDDAWEYCGEWYVERSSTSKTTDEWLYSSSFAEMDAGRYLKSTISGSVVRRRRWIRSVVPKGHSPARLHTPLNTAAIATPNSSPATNAMTHNPRSRTQEVNSSEGLLGGKQEKYSSQTNFAQDMDGQDPSFDEPMFPVEYEPDDHQSVSDHEKHSDIPDPSQRKGSSSMFGSMFGHSSSSIKVHDSALLELGRQIKVLESDFKKWEDLQLKEWKTVTKAHLEAQISKLEVKLKSMQAKIDAESESGLGLNMEEELKSLSEQLEKKKKILFFPLSRIRLGQAGVYLGLDDVWLESASGHFLLDLIPHSETPRIHLLLSGTVFDPDAGISIRLLFQRFKFAGDKNYKSIPKISFEKLAITIGLGCDIGMHFDHSSCKWVTTPKEFQIQVRSFKGPYGINRSMVAAVMSLLTPVLRTALLNRLPQELGLFISSMSSPFCMRGEFDIVGTEISILHTAMHSVPAYLSLCGYCEQQIEMFYGLQRSLERNAMIKTVEELIFYRRTLERNPSIWSKISALWSQAATLYSDKVRQSVAAMTTTPTKASKAPSDNLPYLWGIDFPTLFRGCDELLRKKLSFKFKLSYVDGFFNLNDALDFTYAFVHRICDEALSKNPNSAQESRLQSMLLRIRLTHSQFRELLRSVVRNLDSAQMKVQARCFTGPGGEVRVTITDLIAQLPLNLRLNLSRETNMGNRPLVPYFTSIKPQKDGNMLMEVSHKLNPGDSSVNLTQSRDGTTIRPAQTYPSSSVEFTNSPGNIVGSMDKLFEMLFSSPCLSIVAEKLSTFKPGSEIFTLAVGHRPAQQGQNEAGSLEYTGGIRSRSYTSLEIVKSSSNSALLLAKSDTNGHPSPAGVFLGVSKEEEGTAATDGGCPIHIQTAENIKMLAQVPTAQATVHLAGVVRFAQAHFQDLRAMKAHLEKLLGGEFLNEQMEILKLIFEKTSKYMLSPDLDIAVNINGKLINIDGDTLCLRVETPDEVRAADATDKEHPDLSISPNLRRPSTTRGEHPNLRRPSTTSGGWHPNLRRPSTTSGEPPDLGVGISAVAVAVRADMFVQDIFDDSKAFDAFIKSMQANSETHNTSSSSSSTYNSSYNTT